MLVTLVRFRLKAWTATTTNQVYRYFLYRISWNLALISANKVSFLLLPDFSTPIFMFLIKAPVCDALILNSAFIAYCYWLLTLIFFLVALGLYALCVYKSGCGLTIWSIIYQINEYTTYYYISPQRGLWFEIFRPYLGSTIWYKV